MKKINQSEKIKKWTVCVLCVVATATMVIQIPKLSASEPIAKLDITTPTNPSVNATQATHPSTPKETIQSTSETPEKGLLPEQFKVYYNPNLGISKKVYKSGAEKVILTNNDMKDVPGCYLSCFSKNQKNSVYPIDTNIFLMGQIRVPGQYHNGICHPKGFEEKDVRITKEFKVKCEEAFPERCEKESCWASGNYSSNWF